MEKVLEENMVDDKKEEVIEIDVPMSEPPLDIPADEDKPKKKKPAKKKSKKKIETPAISKNEIGFLIQSVFSLVALKGGEHWNITPQEADTVAQPLSNILKKMDLLEKVSNVSDGAMLVVGLATITVPRVIVSQHISKAKKKRGGDTVGRGHEERQKTDSNKTVSSTNEQSIEGKSNDGQPSEGIYNPIFTEPF